MTDRISSLDQGYLAGDLSLFPHALDNKESLWDVRNNAITTLRQTMTFTSKSIIVDDTSAFPPSGQLRVGPPLGQAGNYELVYYASKTGTTFQNLKRGYAGSIIGYWVANQAWVCNAVHAEQHNALKDALINMEGDIGLEVAPDVASLNGILKAQEIRFLTPKPLFRASMIKGPPPLKVRFQNYTTGHIARYLWDFGDGSTSLEKSPIHTYLVEGNYTVKLNVTTTTGGQGVVNKTNYILVSFDESVPFLYVDSVDNPYSVQTATQMSVSPKEFIFVDQTDGDIVQRNWIFGDNISFTQEDPNVHDITHIYAVPGEYEVTELIQFANGRLKRAQLPTPLVVL